MAFETFDMLVKKALGQQNEEPEKEVVRDEVIISKNLSEPEKKRYSEITTPHNNTIRAYDSRNYAAPANSTPTEIANNLKLSSEMKDQMCQLYISDAKMKDFVLREMEVADTLAQKLLLSGKKLDFGWDKYTLRDVVLHQTKDPFKFEEDTRMFGIYDYWTSSAIRQMLQNVNVEQYLSVLLYYGAPSEEGEILSRVRFVDVMAMDNDKNLHRRSFFRYAQEI